MVIGEITKYPKSMPNKKSKEVVIIILRKKLFSLLERPGSINLKNSYIIYGNDKITPPVKHTPIYALN